MPALIPFSDNVVANAAQLNAYNPITAVKPADQIVNNSVALVNDSALFVAVAANATYEIDAFVIYNSNGTANFKAQWAAPVGVSGLWTIAAPAVGSGVSAPFLGSIAWNGLAAVNGFGTDMFARVSGLLIVGANGGNLQLQWAQNTANASNTIVRATSALIARQVV